MMDESLQKINNQVRFALDVMHKVLKDKDGRYLNFQGARIESLQMSFDYSYEEARAFTLAKRYLKRKPVKQVLKEVLNDSPQDIYQTAEKIIPLLLSAIQSQTIEMEINPVLFAAITSVICGKIVKNDYILPD